MNPFQELAAKYDAWFGTPHGSYVLAAEMPLIMETARVKPGMRVLDAGCGTGIYTRELCRAGADVTGIDISPEMLAIAAAKTEGCGQVRFLQADAANLPFADSEFDMAVSVTAMEFFERPGEALHEMLRVVRPGGSMVVATLGRLSPWSLQRRIKARIARTIFTHTRFYSIHELRAMLRPYEISEWRGGVFVPPFAPGWLIRNPWSLERWGQRHAPAYGTFLVARVDKR